MAGNKRIGELEDAVKDRDRRIAELREEIDELRDLVTRQRENADDFHSIIDSWAEAFDMVRTDDGDWTNGPFIEQHNRLCEAYTDLVARFLGEDKPMRFVDHVKSGFFKPYSCSLNLSTLLDQFMLQNFGPHMLQNAASL